jgi:hypothetical protein
MVLFQLQHSALGNFSADFLSQSPSFGFGQDSQPLVYSYLAKHPLMTLDTSRLDASELVVGDQIDLVDVGKAKLVSQLPCTTKVEPDTDDPSDDSTQS